MQKVMCGAKWNILDCARGLHWQALRACEATLLWGVLLRGMSVFSVLRVVLTGRGAICATLPVFEGVAGYFFWIFRGFTG